MQKAKLLLTFVVESPNFARSFMNSLWGDGTETRTHTLLMIISEGWFTDPWRPSAPSEESQACPKSLSVIDDMLSHVLLIRAEGWQGRKVAGSGSVFVQLHSSPQEKKFCCELTHQTSYI